MRVNPYTTLLNIAQKFTWKMLSIQRSSVKSDLCWEMKGLEHLYSSVRTASQLGYEAVLYINYSTNKLELHFREKFDPEKIPWVLR